MFKIKTNSVSAKTFIRALMSASLIIWIVVYAYMVSSKGAVIISDYGDKLQLEAENINKKINTTAQAHPSSQQIIDLYLLLSEIKLGQKDLAWQKTNLPVIFKIAENVNGSYRPNLNIFAGNIYRDCGQYHIAEGFYKQSLSSISDSRSINEQNKLKFDPPIIKARILNNLGVLYYLLAKNASEKKESYDNYLFAETYFRQANLIVQTNHNICLNKTVKNNLAECLTELKFFNQYE